MAVRDWFKKKDKSTPTLNAGVGTKDSYQGPVQQGTSEVVFRKTGTSTSPGSTNVTSVSSTPSGVGSSSSNNRSSGGSSNRNSGTGTTSGRSSGGKIISTGNTVTLPQSTLETPTLSAGGLEKPVDVKLNRSGGVTVGSRTYVGNAYINELGMTANQYKNKLRQELVQRGSIPRGTGYGRFSYKTQTGIEEISPGEKIIYDKYGNTSVITSEFFGKTFKTIDEYNAAIDRYNKRIESEGVYLGKQSSLETPTKVITRTTKDKKGNTYTYFADGTYQVKDKKGRVWSGEYDLRTGQILQSGTVEPVTPEDVFTVVSGGTALAKLPLKKGLTFAFSNVFTTPVNIAYERAYQPTTNVGKFLKAAATGVAITRVPTLGEAYLADLTKALITKPKQVAKAAIESPAETLGFGVGAGLLGRGLNLAELQFRGIKVEKLNLPGYGEVFIQKIPKYKDVVWVKGTFAQSEKVGIMEQINRLRGRQERVFVQVSSQGIPTKVFSNTKNLGFEVTQVSNPMRGLYQAPPFKFLEGYKNIINTNYGALSFYASATRRTILPNPLELLRSSSRDVFSTQRPFEYIERTYKGIETPKWISEVANAMKEGKDIPKQHKALVDKLYKDFLNTPIEYKGKFYKGVEKANLLNYLNLRLRGSGTKLKVYSALLEYQNKNKVSLAGGAENLSGVVPFGPESQVVRALGTRFFAKSIKDLRKGVKPSLTGKVVELLTGTKRGQKVAMIEGQMVEIQPVRSFEGGKRLPKGAKLSKFKPEEFEPTLVDRLINRRREGVKRPVPRPFVSRYTPREDTYNRGLRRVNDLLRPESRIERVERPRITPRVPRVTLKPRRPRTPRVEPPRVTLRPRYPRIRPPRRKKIPETPRPQKLTPREIQKIKKLKERQLKDGYLTMPTVYDELIGRVGRTTTKKISGFEVSRIA